MTSLDQGAAAPLDPVPLVELPKVVPPPALGSRLAGVFSALVSLALLVMVAQQVRHMDFARITAMIPVKPAFWLTFALYYLAQPLAEWWIYRRLWHLPFSGIGALLRKLVSNELLLGYLGEAQFYAWARTRLAMVGAPFGTIKDITILSALVGNASTLVMFALAWKLVASGQLGMEGKQIFLSLGVVLVTSFAILLFRQKLFSLPPAELRFIAWVHGVRIVAVLALSALMWHLVLPDVAVGMWMVLATLRMLLSRLPFLPNKDVVFAGLAVFLLGHDVQIANLMTMMAALLLAAHLAVGAAFGAADLVESWRAK